MGTGRYRYILPGRTYSMCQRADLCTRIILKADLCRNFSVINTQTFCIMRSRANVKPGELIVEHCVIRRNGQTAVLNNKGG